MECYYFVQLIHFYIKQMDTCGRDQNECDETACCPILTFR
jgi:hypothetical protein